MSTSFEAPTKAFANRLTLAIEAECLTYRETIPWADAIIEKLNQPPFWICDLSTTKYRPDVLKVIRDFLTSEPFEQLDTAAEDYFGFLFYEMLNELEEAAFNS